MNGEVIADTQCLSNFAHLRWRRFAKTGQVMYVNVANVQLLEKFYCLWDLCGKVRDAEIWRLRHRRMGDLHQIGYALVRTHNQSLESLFLPSFNQILHVALGAATASVSDEENG